jgi:hypothetical protein
MGIPALERITLGLYGVTIISDQEDPAQWHHGYPPLLD